MTYAILPRWRICALALAAVGALSLAAASEASAATCSASTTAALEACVTSANANTEANTIVLAGGQYLPGPKPLSLTNTHGLQTIEGPTHLPEAAVDGTNVEVETPELFIIGTGVSAKFKDFVISHAGGGAAAAVEDFGNLTVEQATISGAGPGVVVQPAASANFANSTLSDGESAGLVNEGTATLKNVTVAFNKAEGIENKETLNLSNTIIAENGSPQCSGIAPTTNDHNLSSDSSCGAELSGKNPLLGPLFNNGGGTELHSITSESSPAVFAGDPTVCTAVGSIDQEGEPRPGVSGKNCDIGADEWDNVKPTVHVPGEITKAATSNSGATVTYTAEATSSIARIESFKCTPESGATFPIGTTTVTCTAKDGHGNVTTASFKVTITAPLAFFDNFVKVGTAHVGVLGWGPVKLTSTALSTEIECMQLAFGDAFNEGSPSSGRGEILGFSASGNATKTGTETNRECKFKKGTSEVEAWVTDEPALEQTGTVGKRGVPLTVPWDVELRCGEREESEAPILRLGVPSGTTPSPACKSEEEEKTEIEAEESGRTGCYATTVPAGCMKVNIVQPSLALETVFEGSLRPHVVDGAGTGLNASRWKFEGATSGKLRLATEFATSGTTTGEVKTSGLGASELLQAH